MHAQKSKKAPSFEMALKKLEEIVGALENGEITLSELVDSYKEGVYYKNICQEHIERAELLLDEIDAHGSCKNLGAEPNEGVGTAHVEA